MLGAFGSEVVERWWVVRRRVEVESVTEVRYCRCEEGLAMDVQQRLVG